MYLWWMETADQCITDHGLQPGSGWDMCWCHTGTGQGTHTLVFITVSLSIQMSIDCLHNMWSVLCLPAINYCLSFHVLYSDLVCQRQTLACKKGSRLNSASDLCTDCSPYAVLIFFVRDAVKLQKVVGASEQCVLELRVIDVNANIWPVWELRPDICTGSCIFGGLREVTVQDQTHTDTSREQ